MRMQVQVRVEGFYFRLEPEEITRPSAAVREFEELLAEAARQIGIDPGRGESTLITLPVDRPALQAPKRVHHRQPLVRCPHCQGEALKGAGLAAHIKREHGFLMTRGGGI